MRSIEQFLQAFPHARNTDEPPKELVDVCRKNITKFFDATGYTFNGDEFDKILDFVARYEISLIDTRDEYGLNGATVKIFGLKGKRFKTPKGLLLHGTCGTGKTTAARIVSKMMGFPMFDVAEINALYLGKNGNEWAEEFMFDNERKPIIIDDLGSERKVSSYGNPSPITDIILRRSISWEQHAVPTIYTTNLGHFSDADGQTVTIEKFYGTRIKSRLFGSCVPVLLNGDDWRLKQ